MIEMLGFSAFEKQIEYKFKDSRLLESAFTHSSYANEMKINKIADYERLEFLGDAVLEVVSSDFIFHNYPDMPEGKMTKLRSSMVCEPALAFFAREIGLEKFIRLGRGEETTGGRDRDSIISDVMEAVIGALYLDGGFEKAKDYIYKYILSDLDNKQLFYDSKTILQEMVQTNSGNKFEYVLIDESGPDHNKIFSVEAILNGEKIGVGTGKTKKAAEQMAAYQAIMLIKKKQ